MQKRGTRSALVDAEDREGRPVAADSHSGFDGAEDSSSIGPTADDTEWELDPISAAWCRGDPLDVEPDDEPVDEINSSKEDELGERDRVPARFVQVHSYLREIKEQGPDYDRFARVPKSAILSLRKAPGALALFTLLMCYVPFSKPSSQCYPSIRLLTEELGVSESTLRRDLKVLRDLGFVRVEKRGRRNVYTLYVPEPKPVTSASDTEQICTEYPSDSIDEEAPPVTVNPQQDDGTEAGTSDERDVGKIVSQREVQPGTSLDRVKQLLDFKISANRAKDLIEQFGVEKVDAGIEFVLSQERVRSPAGLLVKYLESDGWAKLTKLKDYLLDMPDPRSREEMRTIGWEIVDIVGSKEAALDALEEVCEDELRLLEAAGNEKQKKVANAIHCRACDARHYIRKYVRTQEEIDRANTMVDGVSRMLAEEAAAKRVALAASADASPRC